MLIIPFVWRKKLFFLNSKMFLSVSITDPWWSKSFTAECRGCLQKGHLLYFVRETAKQEIWITKSKFGAFSQKDHNCYMSCYYFFNKRYLTHQKVHSETLVCLSNQRPFVCHVFPSEVIPCPAFWNFSEILFHYPS